MIYQRQGQVEQVKVQGPVVYKCTLKNQEIRQVDDASEKGLMIKTSEKEVGDIRTNIGGYRTELHPSRTFENQKKESSLLSGPLE